MSLVYRKNVNVNPFYEMKNTINRSCIHRNSYYTLSRYRYSENILPTIFVEKIEFLYSFMMLLPCNVWIVAGH